MPYHCGRPQFAHFTHVHTCAITELPEYKTPKYFFEGPTNAQVYALTRYSIGSVPLIDTCRTAELNK